MPRYENPVEQAFYVATISAMTLFAQKIAGTAPEFDCKTESVNATWKAAREKLDGPTAERIWLVAIQNTREGHEVAFKIHDARVAREAREATEAKAKTAGASEGGTISNRLIKAMRHLNEIGEALNSGSHHLAGIKLREAKQVIEGALKQLNGPDHKRLGPVTDQGQFL